MSKQIFNAIAVITLLVLLAVIGAAGYALVADKATFKEVSDVLSGPFAVVIGYWMREQVAQ